MSDQAETPKEWADNWTIKPDRAHEEADALPAGEHAFTDYRGHDVRLSRCRQHAEARSVYVPAPLMPGDRVRLSGSDGEGWKAERA